MYTAPSSRFIPALSYSHRVVTRVQMTRTDGTQQLLDHTGGQVTADRTQATRRICTVDLADPTLIPRTPADRLSVYGATLRVLRGIQYGDGTQELVPLGKFRVDQVEGDPDLGPVTITGSGFEASITDDAFTAPYSIGSASSAVAGITGLIQATLPNATVINRATDATIGSRTWDRQGDRWAAVQELATAIGAECYADADGQFIIAPLPALSPSSVVWEVAAGEGGALIKPDRGMSRSGVSNSVTAYGENSTDNVPPVSATVEDTNPKSPTYVSGPFGRVTSFYSSPTLTTTGACQAAASALLSKRLKPNAIANIGALPNPLLEPGDVIRVVYADGTRELHQIQSFSIDLTTGGDFTLATISAQEDA